jgi:predicted nucleic acid-binding protein
MSGIKKLPVIYWDSCIYITWLMDDKTYGEATLAAISERLRENAAGKNMVITSTITLIEVLACKIPQDAERQFRQSFRGGDQIAYDVDAAIALKARELRAHYLTTSGRKLATPDAIHLATAIVYNADYLYTFDDKLLKLTKDSAVVGMEICHPFVEQASLI